MTDETLPEPDFYLDGGDEPCYTAATLRQAVKRARREALEEAAKRIESHKTGSINDTVMDAFAQEVRSLLEESQ